MFTTNQLAEVTGLAPQTILNYTKEGIIREDEVEITPDGRHYYKEELACRLILKKVSNQLRNGTLTIYFGESEEAIETFRAGYDLILREKGLFHVDDVCEYFEKLRKDIQKEDALKKAIMKDYVAEVSASYKTALEKLKKEHITEILENQRISEAAQKSIITRRDRVFEDFNELMDELNEEDRHVLRVYPAIFESRRDKLMSKYCIPDIKKLQQGLETDKADSLSVELKTNTVKRIYRKAEQKCFRDAIDVTMREKLSKGYCSLLCIIPGSEDSIYYLLRKMASDEYQFIDIHNYWRATEEEMDVIRYFQETKKVRIADK